MLAPLLTLTAIIIAGLCALWFQSIKLKKQQARLTINDDQPYLLDLQFRAGSSARAKRQGVNNKPGGHFS